MPPLGAAPAWLLWSMPTDSASEDVIHTTQSLSPLLWRHAVHCLFVLVFFGVGGGGGGGSGGATLVRCGLGRPLRKPPWTQLFTVLLPR